MPICYLSMYPTTPYQCWSNNFSGEGFSPHKQELLSIAARIGEKLFWHWIMPVGEISPEVTRRTLVIKWQGQLLNKEPYSIFPTMQRCNFQKCTYVSTVRGHVYMTFSKFSHFWTPFPLVNTKFTPPLLWSEFS